MSHTFNKKSRTFFRILQYIKKGDTFEKAFQRIARDELKGNVSWEDAEFLGIPKIHYYPNEEKLGKTVDIHYVVIPYVVRVTEEFHLEEDEQHWKYDWFKPEELLTHKFVHSYTKEFFVEPHKIPNDSGIYRALMAHYIHYDRQFWSRTQILLAVQGAVLIGGYNLRSFWLGPTVMFLGFLITLIIWRLIFRDINNSRVNQNRMDELAKKIYDYFGEDLPPIRLRADPRPLWSSGCNFIHGVVIGILIINLGLGTLYLIPWDPFPPSSANYIEKLEGDLKEMCTKLKGLEVDLIGKSKSLQKITDQQKRLEKAIKTRAPD